MRGARESISADAAKFTFVVLLLGLVAPFYALVGCGMASAPVAGPEGGVVSEQPTPRPPTESHDASADADGTTDASVAEPASHLHIVNDSLVMQAGFRFCAFANAGAIPPGPSDVLDTPAYPTKTFNGAMAPGLPVGRGYGLPALAPSYESTRIRFVAYFVESLELFGYGNLGCKALVAKSHFTQSDAGSNPSDLIEGRDFDYVADFPAGTFVDRKSYALVMTGCAKTTPPSAQSNCRDFDGANPTSTLTLYARELDATPAAPTKNRVQVIHGADRVLMFGEPTLSLFVAYPNGGSPQLGPITYARLGAADAATEVDPLTSTQALFIHLAQTDDADSIQGAADASQTSIATIAAGKAYTLVVVGSPTVPPVVNNERNYVHIHSVLVPNE
ncbi:MAG: hypothetical protein U0174_27495 [Polyangiaceae bacterium]